MTLKCVLVSVPAANPQRLRQQAMTNALGIATSALAVMLQSEASPLRHWLPSNRLRLPGRARRCRRQVGKRSQGFESEVCQSRPTTQPVKLLLQAGPYSSQ